MGWVLQAIGVLAIAVCAMRGWGAEAGGNAGGTPTVWPVGERQALIQAGQSQEVAAETQRLVRELASVDFKTREAGSKELAQKGSEAFPGLREAVEASGDAEVMARTAEELARPTLAIGPNLPGPTVGMIHQYERLKEARLAERKAPAAGGAGVFVVVGGGGAIQAVANQPANQAANQPLKQAADTEENRLWTMMVQVPNPELTTLFLDIALDQEKDAQMRVVLNRAVAEDAAVRARIAIVQGKPEEAERLLRGELSDPNIDVRADYAALVVGRRGGKFDPEEEYEQLRTIGTGVIHSSAMHLLLLRAGGDLGRAADAAKGLTDSEVTLKVAALIEAGRYGELARTLAGNPRRLWYDLDHAIAYRLAGEDAAANGSITGMVRTLENAWSLTPEMYQSLVRADQAQTAIDLAWKRPENAEVAAALLLGQLRVREARAVLAGEKNMPGGILRQLNALGLGKRAGEWVKGLVAEVGDSGGAQRAFDDAVALDRAGKVEEAAAARARAFALVDVCEQQRGAVDKELATLYQRSRALNKRREDAGLQQGAGQRQGVQFVVNGPIMLNVQGGAGPQQLQALIQAQLQAAAAAMQQEQLLQQAKQQEISAEQRSIDTARADAVKRRGELEAARQIDIRKDAALEEDGAREAAAYWFEKVLPAQSAAGGGAAARYDLALRVARGKITDVEANGLVEAVLRVADGGESNGSDTVVRGVEEFHRMHRDGLAEQLVSRWYDREKDPTCWSLLGDLALEKGEGAKAAEFYRRAAVVNLTNASLMYRMGLALVRAGEDRAAGEKLMAVAPVLVLGDDDQAWKLAEAMRRFEGKEAGDRWLDGYVSRYCVPLREEMGERFVRERERAEARGDYAGALAWQTRALFATPVITGDVVQGYLDAMANVAAYHRLRVLDGFARGDFGVVADGLWREMENGPPDVELMEKVMPELRRADKAEAERVLGRALGRLREVVADYPEVGRYIEELRRVEAMGK